MNLRKSILKPNISAKKMFLNLFCNYKRKNKYNCCSNNCVEKGYHIYEKSNKDSKFIEIYIYCNKCITKMTISPELRLIKFLGRKYVHDLKKTFSNKMKKVMFIVSEFDGYFNKIYFNNKHTSYASLKFNKDWKMNRWWCSDSSWAAGGDLAISYSRWRNNPTDLPLAIITRDYYLKIISSMKNKAARYYEKNADLKTFYFSAKDKF